MVKEQYKQQLIGIIKKYIPEAKIYLYGSRARQTHSPGSDIDLAVDAGVKLDWGLRMNIMAAIEESTVPYFVDVIDIHAVDEGFLYNIKQEWVLWTI